MKQKKESKEVIAQTSVGRFIIDYQSPWYFILDTQEDRTTVAMVDSNIEALFLCQGFNIKNQIKPENSA